jgi:hypothetical protein
MKDACYHCDDRCIAHKPPEEPESCGRYCEVCRCDICDSAGKKDGVE